MTRRPSAELLRATALVILGAMQLFWLIQPISPVLRLFHVGLLSLAIARPADALAVLAGLGPLTTAMAILSVSPYGGAEVMQEMTLAVVTGFVIRRPPTNVSSRLITPAILVAAIAISSLIVVLPARLATNNPVHPWSVFRDFWTGWYFLRPRLWEPVYVTLILIEGMALMLAVERAARRDHTLVPRLLWLSLAGHAAAAGLDTARVLGGMLRSGDIVHNALRILLHVRESFNYDRNAAASVFAMMLLASLALFRRPWRTWIVATVISTNLALGLWIVGSRAALASAGVVLTAVVFATGIRRRGVRRWLTVGATLAAIGGAALAVRYYPGDRNVEVASSVSGRMYFARAALELAKEAPLAGVGIGTFYDHSAAVASQLKGEPMPSENAHNNFLQILAEEGVLGLGTMLWLLGAVLMAAIRAERQAPEPARRWLIAGVIAYMATWLLGHPLLVPQSALTFWLCLGLLAALTPPAAISTSRRGWLVVTVAALLISSGVRSGLAMTNLDLQHRGAGVSDWAHDEAGRLYRNTEPAFSLYLPAGVAVILPLRGSDGSPDPERVEVRNRGRLLYAFFVTDGEWQNMQLQIPSHGSRYERVDFVVMAGEGSRNPDGRPGVRAGRDWTR